MKTVNRAKGFRTAAVVTLVSLGVGGMMAYEAATAVGFAEHPLAFGVMFGVITFAGILGGFYVLREAYHDSRYGDVLLPLHVLTPEPSTHPWPFDPNLERQADESSAMSNSNAKGFVDLLNGHRPHANKRFM